MKYIFLVTIFCTVPLNVFAQKYICWAKPTKEALNKCESKRTCRGTGTYSWHAKKRVAEKFALSSCNKEFGTCYLEYCERY